MSDLDHLTHYDRAWLFAASEARRWSCDRDTRCYADVTSDGLAVERVHHPDCEHFDGEPPADETYQHFGQAAVIDLRAGRTIELTEPPRPVTDSDDNGHAG
jgi:hypothetical protein